MSNIQQKLIENKNKVRREKFLSAVDSEFSDFLSGVEFSNEVSCMKHAAFPQWNEETNVISNSRGQITGWNNFNFKTWQELITVLEKFNKVKNFIGWFFIEHDGPYYRISLNAFLSHIPSMSNYGIQNDHYRFGWTGEVDDVGIIIEKNPIVSSDKKFNISIWGI